MKMFSAVKLHGLAAVASFFSGFRRGAEPRTVSLRRTGARVSNRKGFSMTELIFAACISALVVAGVFSAWMFTYRSWTEEGVNTEMRVDLLKGLETIKSDLRLSSINYMSFYPAGGEPYAAISMPVAVANASGFFTLDANGNIQWDKTVIYHLYTQAGVTTLRRTVLSSRDNSLTASQRYTELQNVVQSGTGGGGSVTDTNFMKNVDIFEISSLSQIIDFYDVSATPVRAGKMVFGWAKMAPGSHAIRFTITGKNASSSGYGIGIDNIMIEPAGGLREAEYYSSSFAPGGALVTSGGTANRVYETQWANNNYLKFAASGVGSYMEITDPYDLWRESSFDSASLNNTTKFDEEVRVKLKMADLTDPEPVKIVWSSYVEAGDSQSDGRDGNFPGTPIVVRTVLENGYIANSGDMVRVNLKAPISNPIRIDSTYITRKAVPGDNSQPNGLLNQSTSGKTTEQYHRHQQLFFKDIYDGDNDGDTTEILQEAWIPAGSEIWSEWSAFPMKKQLVGSTQNEDYLLTYSVPDLLSVTFPAGWSASASAGNCKYWQGNSTHTLYVKDGISSNYAQVAGTPVWTGVYTVFNSDNIYIASQIDTMDSTGTVESQVFDTTLTAPAYNQIKWSANMPTGTTAVLKARSSASSGMVGATAWDSITGTSASPSGLSIGTGRYVQFYAKLSAGITWETTTGSSETYTGYVTDQLALPVYSFPSSSGNYYLTKTALPWIDDVEIDWPPAERMCAVTGYVAKESDFGQAKVTIDGSDVVKVLGARVKVSKTVSGRTLTEENYVEVEPRNTGR